METSRFLCSVTGYHGPLNGVLWLCVPRQVDPGGELALIPAILIIKIRGVFKPASPYQVFYLVLWSACPTLERLHFSLPSVLHILHIVAAPSAGWPLAGGPLGDIFCPCCVVWQPAGICSPPVQCSGGQQVYLPPVLSSLDLIDFFYES